MREPLLQDFVWWTGLPVADAREALALAAPALAREEVDGETYWLSPDARRTRPGEADGSVRLLPPFDEWLVGYKERGDVLDPAHRDGVHALLSPTLVRGGRVIGTWTRSFGRSEAVLSASFFRTSWKPPAHALRSAAERYGRFVGRPAVLS